DTVFMIHGMWGSPWYWQNYKNVLEKAGYRCVTATLRYHDMNPSASPDPRLGSTSLLDYAEDLEREIRSLGVKPILLGHSMGGLLALMLSARDLAKATVLLTPASPAGINPYRVSVVRSFVSVLLHWAFWKKPMRQTYGEAVYSMLQLLPPDDQRRAYERFVYESGRAFSEIAYWFIDPRHATRVDAKKITCPILVIGAAQDRITPASVVRRVAKKYKNVATYKEFPNHAHWVVGEPGWEEVAEYVGQWLSTLDANRAPASRVN
ncbi:MAG TPA: alpha/beta hydrolase, partial [Burkholderiales bacterium]|nr:alpha/beta hydrolase [Burkholderiales bacterium]